MHPERRTDTHRDTQRERQRADKQRERERETYTERQRERKRETNQERERARETDQQTAGDSDTWSRTIGRFYNLGVLMVTANNKKGTSHMRVELGANCWVAVKELKFIKLPQSRNHIIYHISILW